MKSNPWRRVALTVSAMVMVLLLAASWRFLMSRGVFTSVDAKQPGMCRVVAQLPGISDMVADERSGTVFIASRSGGLFAYAKGAVTPLRGTPKDFHPLALSQGGSKLQVIFARQDGRYAISVFDLAPGAVTEIGRLSTDVLTDPAALAAIDDSRFYLINRHGSRSALGHWLDDTFLFPRAQLLYFDGMKFVTVAKQLNSPAGIALSPDAARLYVSEDYPGTFVTFIRNEFTGGTENPAALTIGAGLGKLHVANDGSVIVAARPKSGMGQVWRVKDGAAEFLYARRDGEIAAAAQLGRHLLIGGAAGLTDCAL